jgi:manganese/zinc/iron transport system permease protein
MIQWSWSLDGWIIVIAILSSVSAAILGNFLVLRRMSLLGDAISHAVLPGLAIAFFISGSRTSWMMLVGAVASGILTALLTHWLQRQGQVDEGASMGVVFTTLFALGLVMIVQAADRVDLDPGCVLYGSIELTPLDTLNVSGWQIPRVAITLSIVLLINILFVIVFYKELKLSSFDAVLATTSGFNASFLHYLLMTLVAVTTVACFESVGNILVVAMFIVPASTALLLSERLGRVIVLSTIVAALSAILGHVGAIVVPGFFGYRSTTTASMMAVASGLIFFMVSLFSFRSGVIVRWVRRRYLGIRILAEDIVAALYRFEERGQQRVGLSELSSILIASRWSFKLAGWWQIQRGRIQVANGLVGLTEHGRDVARNLVRSHRLWETYLVDQAGTSLERIHGQAEKLEHYTDVELQKQLVEASTDPQLDPHGREIPKL